MKNTSIQTSGPLFEKVQKERTFSDSKVFVDCIPKTTPEEILRAFSGVSHENLHQFVEKYFTLPSPEEIEHVTADTPLEYISLMWDALQREMEAETPFDTLLPLPYPHIVPGGRFRESYYWDSYFEAIGLHAEGKQDIIDHLILNFCSLIDRYGYIPNGNRSYYLSRSQAPFFSHLIELSDVAKYLPYLEKEYLFWMKEGSHFIKGGLNRFYDAKNTPREESFYEDFSLLETMNDERYRHIRSACESGWDFSSRWLKDQKNLSTANTCDLFPVDLNALLYHMERTLGFDEAAALRQKKVTELLWDAEREFFFDYNFALKTQTDVYSLAACYPLFVSMATHHQAEKVATLLESRFLQKGGLITTLTESGQQWDAKNGWAPLQWIAYKGLRNYGFDDLAREIAARFLTTCRHNFEQNGTFLEKYNMADPERLPQDGEYTLQTGFGWTNGVYVGLTAEMGE